MTLSLYNTTRENERPADTFYQVGFDVEAADGSAPFVEYRTLEGAPEDVLVAKRPNICREVTSTLPRHPKRTKAVEPCAVNPRFITGDKPADRCVVIRRLCVCGHRFANGMLNVRFQPYLDQTPDANDLA